MKRSQAWPGKIADPKAAPTPCPSRKKLMHSVLFFGTHDYAWISETDIKPYKAFKQQLNKGKSAQFKVGDQLPRNKSYKNLNLTRILT